jgi:hypothetical protein
MVCRRISPHWVSRAIIHAVCATLLLAACGGEAVRDNPVQTPDTPNVDPSLARLEPTSGTYFGVNLDWDNVSAAEFNERVGRPAAVYVQFVRFPFSDVEHQILEGFLEQVSDQNGIALITLEPIVSLTEISTEMANDLAELLKEYNDRGIPVIVRFAHEMNGSWYPWSQQPGSYIAAFRRLSDAIHAGTSQTAMLWAPNYGAGCPFTGGAYAAAPGTDDFQQLDTNADGQLDRNDDPYSPYYPGDDAVDWVGLSLYHWGNSYPWGENETPEDGKFIEHLTGTYNALNGDERDVPDFNATFAEGYNKPMAIVETVALYQPGQPGPDELSIKEGWWQQVFACEIGVHESSGLGRTTSALSKVVV